mmetsp:Transcript_32021/g.58675  ORF Transcript_32021/g.58675 Transcript_32021/m.58675 type:complete len:468 (+) Transcript_32021:276-1679(+)
MSLFNTIIIAIALVAFGSATDAIDSADVGLNANLILAETVITSSVCNKGFVDCRDGFEVIDGETTTRTCHDACGGSGGSCCSDGKGLDACDHFSGLVCKDGSCNASNGGKVCKDASIERVINSCIGGEACMNAGSNGFVGYVVDSCQGDMACSNAGSDGGKIGIIRNSCTHGNEICHSTGRDGGFIGMIDDSCKFGDRNCLGLAEEGSIGYIIRSCSGTEDDLTHDSCSQAGKGIDILPIEGRARFDRIDCRNGMAYANELNTEKSCRAACAASGGSCCIGEDACTDFTGLVRTDGSCSGPQACYGAKIGLVVNSCVDQQSCDQAGGNGADGVEGHIGSISNSCHGSNACGYAASGGSIGTIENSCNNGDYNCIGVAYEGDIGQILSSCSGTEDAPVDKACYHVGRGEFIYDDIDNCCNSVNEVCCQDSTECSDTVTPLQEECTAIASPSPSPSMDFRGFARRFADE